MKKEANAGDLVEITTDDETTKGIVMPSNDNSAIVIKLDNGYNIGIDMKKIKKLNIVKKYKEVKDTKSRISKDNKLPTVTILHTGGTIASKVDYGSGAVTAKFSAEDLIEMFPEIATIANIETELIANMMSEDMMFKDYKKIAAAIKKHSEKGTKGIIIGHGTDTLAITAAALSFMFEKINIPVLIVGSQRSSDRGSTDASSNLVCATEFIAKSNYKGVAICMHDSSSDNSCAILPATKTRKMHTSRRDAFKPINSNPIALIDYKTRKINILKKDKREDKVIVLKDKFETEVGLLKTHPNMKSELFEFYTKNYKGIILEATGLGQAPTNLGDSNLKNYELLKKFIKQGGIVAITSQCLFGRVHPSVYTNLRRLSDIGCIFCEDILPETAFIKLAWLLGNYKPEQAKELLTKNLKGEITDCTSYKEDFLE